MKKLKKYSQLFEADLKDTLPEDYLENIERKAREMFGNGPTQRDFMEGMRIMQEVQRIQQGHQEELTEIGKEVILDHYGSILDGVKLDIKIVNPDDDEKMEMTMNTQDQPEEPDYDSDVEIPFKIPQEEIDRRKLLNNLMQGEGQNVHSMMYAAKDKIDAINPDLLDLYTRGLEINRKMDWDPNRPPLEDFMKNMAPELSNMCEVDWNEDEEDEGGPTIKARVLDLPALIHETIKGIYELMSADAIPEDPVMAEKIMKETDTLNDEEEDIKYGPFIAADLRDYINDYLERKYPQAKEIQAIKEHIYGEMIALSAADFVKLIKTILVEDKGAADVLMNRFGIVQNVLNYLENPQGYEDDTDEYQDDVVETEPQEDDLSRLGIKPKEEKDWRDKDYINMSQGEIENLMNAELDKDNPDYDKLKELQKFIKT